MEKEQIFLSKNYRVNKSYTKSWVRQCEKNKFHALAKAHYSIDFDLIVLIYREENELSYRTRASRFGIRHNSINATWNRKLQECGPADLEVKQKRPRKHMSKTVKN